MDFEFDRAKDARNIVKHGLSLAGFVAFDTPPTIFVDARVDYGETRYLAIGRIGGAGHCIVFTRDDETMRLISFRRAHNKEMRRYER